MYPARRSFEGDSSKHGRPGSKRVIVPVCLHSWCSRLPLWGMGHQSRRCPERGSLQEKGDRTYGQVFACCGRRGWTCWRSSVSSWSSPYYFLAQLVCHSFTGMPRTCSSFHAENGTPLVLLTCPFLSQVTVTFQARQASARGRS
jgi:hypothetical protein